MPDRPVHRRIVTLASGLVGLAVVGFATTASAAPEHRTNARPVSHRTLSTEAPGGDLLPDPSVVGSVNTGLTTSARATRARVDVFIPTVPTVIYNAVDTTAPIPGGFGQLPADLLPARSNPECNYYSANYTVDIYATDVDEKTHTYRQRPGTFPAAHVSMLAFGSIPVTATLTVRQPVVKGLVQPLQAKAVVGVTSERKDDPDPPNFGGGCDPAWEANAPLSVFAHGRVEAVISDVAVDGRVVPVGGTCHTMLDLNLIGSYSDLVSGGNLIQAYDPRTTETANPIRRFPGSRNLVIPPFTGCRGHAGENVSRLVTAMVSGPDNTVVVNQAPLFNNLFDPHHPSKCYYDPTNVFPPTCAQTVDNLNPPYPIETGRTSGRSLPLVVPKRSR